MAQGTITLEIRTARQEDLAAVVRIYHHYIANTHITFDTEAYTQESRLRFDFF